MGFVQVVIAQLLGARVERQIPGLAALAVDAEMRHAATGVLFTYEWIQLRLTPVAAHKISVEAARSDDGHQTDDREYKDVCRRPRSIVWISWKNCGC